MTGRTMPITFLAPWNRSRAAAALRRLHLTVVHVCAVPPSVRFRICRPTRSRTRLERTTTPGTRRRSRFSQRRAVNLVAARRARCRDRAACRWPHDGASGRPPGSDLPFGAVGDVGCPEARADLRVDANTISVVGRPTAWVFGRVRRHLAQRPAARRSRCCSCHRLGACDRTRTRATDCVRQAGSRRRISVVRRRSFVPSAAIDHKS